MPSFSATVTTEVDVDFEVFCAGCGAGLCNDSEGGNTKNRGMPYVSVKPCSKCMENEYESGFAKGYNQGQKEAA